MDRVAVILDALEFWHQDSKRFLSRVEMTQEKGYAYHQGRQAFAIELAILVLADCEEHSALENVRTKVRSLVKQFTDSEWRDAWRTYLKRLSNGPFQIEAAVKDSILVIALATEVEVVGTAWVKITPEQEQRVVDRIPELLAK